MTTTRKNKNKTLAALASFAFVVASLGVLAPARALTNCTVSAADLAVDAEEAQLLELINAYRQANGLNPLVMDPSLTRAAAWFSRDMATDNYFPADHVDNTPPSGRDLGTRLTQCDVTFGPTFSYGENIAAGNQSAEATFEQWVNSPTHNAIMLTPGFTHAGIGRAFDPNSTYGWYWTLDVASGITSTPSTSSTSTTSTTVPPSSTTSTTPTSSTLPPSTTTSTLPGASTTSTAPSSTLPPGSSTTVPGASTTSTVISSSTTVPGASTTSTFVTSSTFVSSTSTTVPSTTSTAAPPAGTCGGLTPTIVGTAGSDSIFGTPGPDVIAGGGGNDLIQGLGGDDVICGDAGNDLLRGGDGNDRLIGGAGSDQLQGDNGNDQLAGGGGNDQLSGGPGTDALNGEADTDQCRGDTGSDSATACEGVSDVP